MATDDTEKRKLAAIMFTDMVGFTALSQHNETTALKLLEEHREILRSIFPQYDGQEIKTIGDGFLVEFASALEAARCAIAIQRAMAQRNPSAPADKQIQVRVGIHVGDVVHREGDVLGDGVNIASRIESLAEPGGICISIDVARQIQHNLEASVVQLGAAELKNVQAPMDICRIVLPWEKGATTFTQRKSAKGGNRTLRPLVAVTVLAIVAIYFIWQAFNQPQQTHTATALTSPTSSTSPF